MTTSWRMTRRAALTTGAAVAALPLVHVRTGHAAGTLKLAFYDHSVVPGANTIMQQQVAEWAKANDVSYTLDFITPIGNKLQITAAAESLAGSGHDVMQFFTWDVHSYADKLQPMDDVVKVLADRAGPFNAVAEYLARIDGHWMAVPTAWGGQTKPSCARISLMKQHAGIDVTKMYLAHEVASPEAPDWTHETFLKAAAGCEKAGYPFALGLSRTTDSVDWVGAMFAAYGAELVDAKGEPQVKSDAMREVLEYAQRLVRHLPPEAVSYDDASNNRALVSGKTALIFNPPSAWAAAKKDAPEIAADCWTFSSPAGPKGRYIPYLPFFWGYGSSVATAPPPPI